MAGGQAALRWRFTRYVRSKLNEKYGDAVQPKTGPIRADLLGNMWAQEWGNIYDVVAPAGSGDLGYDIGDLLTAQGKKPLDMVKTGEGFYSSLGFAPLPDTFWKRSQFVKPADREVVCHASAWDVDNKDDLRIKMCIKVNADDFVTIHHELGHNYYQRAYNKQAVPLSERRQRRLPRGDRRFRRAVDHARISRPDRPARQGEGAERRQGHRPSAAPGDGQGRLPAVRPAGRPLALGRLRRHDQARRLQHGVDATAPAISGHRPAGRAAGERVRRRAPSSTSRATRPTPAISSRACSSSSSIKAACEQAGWTGPLHRCSFYGNKEVGAKLNAMLEMGASKPWPDALEAFTGSREMSGKAMADYFAPLKAWLDAQNKGKPQGW